MNITIGADHAGVELKDHLVAMLRAAGHQVSDVGTTDQRSTDYPDFAMPVARAVQQKTAERGVLVCGSGIGMAITANRFLGVRAAVLRTLYDAQLSREHNDTNIACFGARVTDASTADALLTKWLNTAFAGDRHLRRVEKIDEVTACPPA